MHALVFMSSRFSFFLMLVVTIPLCMHTQYILELWLGDVPEYTAAFVRIMLIVGLINTLQNPTMTALHATGNIKKVQIVESSLLLSVVPVAYFCLKFLHILPVMVFVVYFIIEFVAQFVRVYMIYPMIKLRMKDYFIKVMWPISVVTTLAVLVCWISSRVIVVSDFWMLLVAIAVYVLIIGVCVFFFGLQKIERQYAIKLVHEKVMKIC